MMSRKISVSSSISFFAGQLTDVIDTIRNNGNLKTSYQALLQSGLAYPFAAATGPLTIFAPTDDAFAKLSPETLQYLFKPENEQLLADLFSYHVALGNLSVAAIEESNPPISVPVFSGQSVVITQQKNTIKVNDATVITADIFAANGVVHAIDSVLLSPPGDLADTIMKSPIFRTLSKALQAADLVQTLRSRGPFTVFAPTDYAFQKLPPGTLDNLLKPENKIALFKILTYHIVDGNLTTSALDALKPPTTITSFNRKLLSVNEYGNAFFINDATVVIRDMPATNGVIHGINQVLLPSSFK